LTAQRERLARRNDPPAGDPIGGGGNDRGGAEIGLFDKPNFTMPFNVAGYPAISICAGFGADGLPVAIQLVGKPFQKPTLFRVAYALERRPLSAASAPRSSRPSLRPERTPDCPALQGRSGKTESGTFPLSGNAQNRVRVDFIPWYG
jgi:hypothetical protein